MIRHWRYLKYLARHKWFVFVAGLRVGGIPIWRLIIHDWSKFMPCEWGPYTRFFYGPRTALVPEPRGPKDYVVAAEVRSSFDLAWLHHQHHNPHHWQHWVLRNDDGDTRLLLMPDRLVREMVADWMGAGRAITGKWDAASWYQKNSDKMMLHGHVRWQVENLLEVEHKVPEGDVSCQPS